MTLGMTPDGYMLPHRPARIRVFAEPGQTAPESRSVCGRSQSRARRRATSSSPRTDAGRHALARGGDADLPTPSACRRTGFADIVVNADDDTVIGLGVPYDPTTVSQPRHVAVRLADLSLGPPSGRCRP